MENSESDIVGNSVESTELDSNIDRKSEDKVTIDDNIVNERKNSTEILQLDKKSKDNSMPYLSDADSKKGDLDKTEDNKFICLTITLDEKFQRTPFSKIQKAIDNIIEKINTETDIDINVNINIKTMKVFLRHVIFSCPKSKYYYLNNTEFDVFNKFMCLFHFTMERCLKYIWFLEIINDLLKTKGKLCVPKEINKVLSLYLKPMKLAKS